MTLVILTRKPKEGWLDYIYYWQGFKILVKKVLHRKRGPDAVAQSLRQGLENLKYEYLWDPKNIPQDSVVGVLSGVRALQYAIRAKKNNRIAKIIAGPNIVASPVDFNNLLLDKSINTVLVPSEWVKEYYLNFSKELNVKVWASGVDLPPMTNCLRDHIIIFRKKCPESLYKSICGFLDKQEQKYRIVEYGKYQKEQYLNDLQAAKALIYLQETESQGLALFEAWASDVPTLVWNKGFAEIGGVTVRGKVSCPFLNESNGMDFCDYEDFTKVFQSFIMRKYEPRDFCKNNFTNEIATKKYINFI